MSNQRRGNWRKASVADDGREMRLYSFIKRCRTALQDEGMEDASFYFEMIEDHLKEGKSLPSDEKGVSRLLGL